MNSVLVHKKEKERKRETEGKERERERDTHLQWPENTLLDWF